MLQIMNSIKWYPTQQKIAGAYRAWKYQALLGCPSTFSLVYYIAKNLIIDCDITVDYNKQAEQIYEKNMPLLKVKVN